MSQPQKPRIFISYRRADSEYIVGRIYDRLLAEFGPGYVFKDVENIPPGRDFRDILRKAILQADVLLIIIGPDWLNIKGDDGRRRLDAPNDYVRFEIETALGRDDVLMLPVLVKNAGPPDADQLPPGIEKLAYLNAVSVRGDPDFNRDIRFLIKFLRDEQGQYLRRNLEISQGLNTDDLTPPQHPTTPQNTPTTAKPSARLVGYGLAVLVAVLLVCLTLAALSALLDTSSNGDGEASVSVQGYDISADVPSGWESGNQLGNILIASNDDLLNEAQNRMVVNETALISDLFSMSTYRLNNSGTLVGVSIVTDATGLGLNGLQFASEWAALFTANGLTASSRAVSNGDWSGGQITYGSDGYGRRIDYYDLPQAGFGFYVRVFVFSDTTSGMRQDNVDAIIRSITVN
jgi:hypothetical protein